MSTSATTGTDNTGAGTYPAHGLDAKALAQRLADLAGPGEACAHLIARTALGERCISDVTPSVHGIIVSLTDQQERALSVAETIKHLRISQMLPSRRASDDPVYVRAQDRLSVVAAVDLEGETLVMVLQPFE